MSAANEQDPLVRIAGRRPKAVCAKLELEPATVELLGTDPAPAAFLTTLLQQEKFGDAIRYLAHALPKADAVAWACACVRLGRTLTPAAEAAIASAEAWAREPTEANCRAAEAAAGCEDKAAGFAATAAFWSGNSLAPPDLPAVAPAPELTSTAVFAALAIAATQAPPAEIPERYRRFLSHGIVIARTPM